MRFMNGEMILAQIHSLTSKECIPTNTILTGPLQKPIADLEGALGGLMFSLVIFMAVLLAVVLVITILSNKAPVYMKALASVFAIPLVVILVIVAYTAIVTGFNTAC